MSLSQFIHEYLKLRPEDDELRRAYQMYHGRRINVVGCIELEAIRKAKGDGTSNV